MNNQKHGLDNPATIKRLLQVFYILCGILLLLDFVLARKIAHPLESLPAFYAIYGFVGCVILVVIAKWMRRFLMRDEDYYQPDKDQSAAQRGTDDD